MMYVWLEMQVFIDRFNIFVYGATPREENDPMRSAGGAQQFRQLATFVES